MKIGIDGREFVKNKITGIGRFLYDFLSYAVKIRPNWQFFVFLNQNCELKLETNNLVKIFIPEKITFLWDQYVLFNKIKEYKLDLFYSPYYKFPVFTKIPVITTIFDIIYLLAEPYKNYLKYKFYVKNFIKLTADKVKKIITCSYTAKNDLIKFLNIKEEKIEVVYLAISEKFTPQPKQKIEEVKNKYQIDKKYILYVGNSKPHKNLLRLISAYKLLPEELKKDYMLVLAGVKKSEIVDFLENKKSINVIEFVEDEDLPSLYSGAELFVFPSLYEGFGLPPLEAMSCGCPVVASNTSCIPEVLKDSVLYFNPYDIRDMSHKIIDVLSDNTIKYSLRNKGMEYVKSLLVNKTYKRYIDIFEEIINKNIN